MKIQYSGWQQINLISFSSALDASFSSTDAFLETFNTFDDSNAAVTNKLIKGVWGNYNYEIKGNHFADSNPNITASLFAFSSTFDSLKIAGKYTYNYNTDVFGGLISKIDYVNNATGVSYEVKGSINFDASGNVSSGNVTSYNYLFGGNKFSLLGNFSINANGDISDGAIKTFSIEDNLGHRLTVSDASMTFNSFNTLTESETTLDGLYNALLLSGKDTITAGASDDILDGGAGADTLIGGLGNDTYLVDLLANGKLQDKVTEAKNAGIDTLDLRGDLALSKAVTVKLAANVENLDISLTNHSLLNLTGDKADNTLTGNAADNLIDGGKGADSMIGGAGNDTYVLDHAGDLVVEALNEGVDQVNIKFTAGSYTLGDNVENGFIAHAKAFTLTGNALDNSLIGGGGANTLNGAAGVDTLNGGKGNDILNGGTGNDTLTGGAGVDTFVFSLSDIGTAGAPSIDVMTDFSLKQKDVLDLRDLLPNANENDLVGLLNYLDVTTDGTNTEIRISAAGGFTGGLFDASAEDAHITLANVNLLAGTDESTLLQTLMTKNQLLID